MVLPKIKAIPVIFKILCMKHIKWTIHTLNILTVIIYSPSCSSKPAWFTSVEKKKTFNSKSQDILLNISLYSYCTLQREGEYKGKRDWVSFKIVSGTLHCFTMYKFGSAKAMLTLILN